MSDFDHDVRMSLQSQVQFCDKPLVKGDAWYLLDYHWFKQLKNYVGLEGDESANPGPIDNKPLFKEDGTEIRDHLIDELDYAMVPEEVWTVLLNNFGLTQGQEPIKRKVVEHGMFVKHCKVEVYFTEFQLAENSNPEEIIKNKFSETDTLETIQNTMRTKFNIASDADTRLWNKYSSNTYEQLSRLHNTVQDAGLFGGQMIIIEVKNENGTWPRAVGYNMRSQKSFANNASSSRSVNEKIVISREVEEIQAKIEGKKKEHLGIEKGIACLERKQEELERERKKIEVEKKSLSDRRKKAIDEIKSLEDSLNEYVEVTKDLVTKLKLEPWAASKNIVTFLIKSIEEKEAELSCPVCLQTAAPPIFSCQQMHLVCKGCQPRMSSCPECREAYQGQPRRHRYAERDAEELKKMREELSKMTS